MKKEFNQIYLFKITLEGIRSSIWRRIQVPETYSFRDLHIAIQDAMGWGDYHLYEFKVGDICIEADEEGFCVDAMWKAFRPKPRTASAGKTKLSEFIFFFRNYRGSQSPRVRRNVGMDWRRI